MKEVKLHTPEAIRNKPNTLFTRRPSCRRTTTAKIVNIKKLSSGITAHILITKSLSATQRG